jgi:hypothetical protein
VKFKKKEQKNMESKKMVFLDESSINTGYGKAIGETKVNDYVPNFKFERISIISGVSFNVVVVQ